MNLSSRIPSVALPDYHLEHQAAVDYYAIQYPHLVHHHHLLVTNYSITGRRKVLSCIHYCSGEVK